MSPRLLGLSAALLVFAGCGPSGDADVAPAIPTDDVEETAPPTEADAGAGYEALVGSARGITVIGTQGVETTVGFGTPQAEALATLIPLLGDPAEEGTYEECGADPFMAYVGWPNELTLNFSEGALVGWWARGDDERIQTAEGVQLGSSLDMLEMASPGFQRIEESTLEGEFALGDEYANAEGEVVGGFLSASDSTARVDGLYAGITCFVR